MRRVKTVVGLLAVCLAVCIAPGCAEEDGADPGGPGPQADTGPAPDGSEAPDAGGDSAAPAGLTDVFAYFQDSVFDFVIKDGTSDVKTTRMTWTVTSYDDATGVATVTRTLDPAGTKSPLPATFHFKAAADGALQYSADGGSWSGLTSPGGDPSFLFCVKAAKPSSLLGSVDEGIKPTSVTYPGGSSTGYMVYSEYNATGQDRYFYSDYGREHYAKDTGFVRASCFTADHIDSSAIFTHKREVEMVSYKIQKPDGTVAEGGQQKPAAPTDLKVKYVKYTKDGQKRADMRLTWSDNSSNETHFNIYMKAEDGKFHPLSEFALNSGATFQPDTFPPNTFSGTIKAGWYVNWDAGTYTFRLTAASLDLESDPSNEASATTY